MKTLFLFLAFTASAFSQNEMWNLPLARQDTTLTFTIAQGRVDSLVHVTDKGRHIVQGVYDAEYTAARLRIGSLTTNITPAEVGAEVARRRTKIAAELNALDAENMTATDYRTAARTVKAKARQYTRISKKGAQVTE